MTTTKEVLVKSKELIEKYGWTQGEWARDSSGAGLRAVDLTRCIATGDCSGLCLGGAALAASEILATVPLIDRYWAWYDTVDHLAKFVGKSVADWNDSSVRTREEVMDVLDKAIASCDATPA